MGKLFVGNLVRTLSLSLIFLCAVSLAGEGPADEYSEMRANPPDWVRHDIRSSAPRDEYCGLYGSRLSSFEAIDQVRRKIANGKLILTVHVRLRCGTTDPCWFTDPENGDGTEYVNAWIDWDGENGFDNPGERVMSMSLQVREREGDKGDMLVFESETPIPADHVTDTWMRITLGYGENLSDPCDPTFWDWGDMSDQMVSLPAFSYYHSADYRPSDYEINNSEMLRVWQFYKELSYQCASDTGDGYASGNGDQSCPPHNSDYKPQDWQISTSEFLRIVQLHNSTAYRTDPESEDGFAPADSGGGEDRVRVVLKKTYADDARENAETVYKAGGSQVEIVHEIVNSEDTEQRITLMLQLSGEWNHDKEKYCYIRDDAMGTNYADITDQHGYADGMHEIRDLIIPGKKRLQMGIRFIIPDDTSPGGYPVHSWISESDDEPSVTDIQIVDRASAIIVTNRGRLFEMCGNIPEAEASECIADVTDLLGKLFDISDKSSTGEKRAVVYYADRHDDKIRDWDNLDCETLYAEETCGYVSSLCRKPDETDCVSYDKDHHLEIVHNEDYRNENINEVANILDERVEEWAKRLTPEYLLIVGGDDILPFYRLRDKDDEGTCIYEFPVEERYIAGFMDYYFTDTTYADIYPDDKGTEDFEKGGVDIPCGRIVGASPKDMTNLIDRGLEGPQGKDGEHRAVIASTGCVGYPNDTPCVSMGNIMDIFETNGFSVSSEMIESDTWTDKEFTESINLGAKYVLGGSHGLHDSLDLGVKLRGYCTDLRHRENCLPFNETGDPDSENASRICPEKNKGRVTMYEYLRSGEESGGGYSRTLNDMEQYLSARGCELQEYEEGELGKITCYLKAKYAHENLISSKNGYFVAMNACYAGAIAERSSSPLSSLPYAFIRKGACGYFGSSGFLFTALGIKCEREVLYGEKVFNSFFENIPRHNSFGEAFMETLTNYEPVHSWQYKDEQSVTEFNLFGLPWMNPNFDGRSRKSELKDSSDDRKGYAVIESAPHRVSTQPSVRTSARSGGTFSRSYTFAVSEYEIVQEDSYDFVRIPGSETLIADFKPVIPYFNAERLFLPRDASLVSLRVTDGKSISLGQLSIPNTADPYSSPPPSSEYTDETDVTGLFPDPNCWHFLRQSGDHRRLTIRFAPVQHNVDTKETTLWTEATVEVQYEVGEAVFVSDFRAGKTSYKTTEDITASVTLGNAGDTDLSGLTAVLSLMNYFSEILFSTEQPLPALPAGEATETEVRMSNGAMTDDYILVLEITDSHGNVIASAEDMGIRVTSEGISGISVPDGPHEVGSEITFTVTFENFNPRPVDGLMIVSIYDENGYDADTFADVLEAPAGSVTEITLTRDTGHLEPGHYRAKAVFMFLTDDGETFERYSQLIPFSVSPPGDLNGDLSVDMADFILALRVLVTENIDAPPPGSTDTDGKLGLDDVLRILREIAEDMPVSP